MADTHRLTETASGVRVISEIVPSVRSVALGLWVRTGSRDEDPAIAGISHFLEHLLFKGTPTRTAIEISEEFDGMGAAFNAFTSKEATSLHARFLDEHLDDAFALMGEMFLEPTFPDIDSEREVVLEEIAMYEDEPSSRVHDYLSEAVFGDTPLGRRILGSAEVISTVSVETISKYHASRYAGPDIVISAAGQVDHDELVALTEGLQPPHEPATRPEPASPFESGRLVFADKDTEQYHICFGGPGIKRADERRYQAAVLDSILGGSSSSRLFREIREERGLAYAVGTYSESYEDTGLFGIYVGTREENVSEVCRLVGVELETIMSERVCEDELRRARENVKGRLVLSEESNMARMSRLGRAILHDLPVLTLDEILAKVEAVTADEITALATELFESGRISSACVGRDEDLFRASSAEVNGALAA
jgi:predicted Zn-dependent peptidase